MIKNGKVSQESMIKYDDFRGLVDMHTRIVQGIYTRRPVVPPYTYIDLNCATPQVELEGSLHDTCGVIAAEFIAKRFGSWYMVFMDENKDRVGLFEEKLGGLDNRPDQTALFVSGNHDADFETIVKSLCDDVSPFSVGLLFHDPYGVPSYATLKKIFDCPNLKGIDLLVYGQITAEKRIRGAQQDGSYFHLPEALKEINKKHWLVRYPHGSNQWVFLIGTNWPGFPEWKQRAFYKEDSRQGQLILKRLMLSSKEAQRQYGEPIPLFNLSEIPKAPRAKENWNATSNDH